MASTPAFLMNSRSIRPSEPLGNVMVPASPNSSDVYKRQSQLAALQNFGPQLQTAGVVHICGTGSAMIQTAGQMLAQQSVDKTTGAPIQCRLAIHSCRRTIANHPCRPPSGNASGTQP